MVPFNACHGGSPEPNILSYLQHDTQKIMSNEERGRKERQKPDVPTSQKRSEEHTSELQSQR